MMPHCFALCCLALRCITLTCPSLRFIALRYDALLGLACLALLWLALLCFAMLCFASACAAFTYYSSPVLIDYCFILLLIYMVLPLKFEIITTAPVLRSFERSVTTFLLSVKGNQYITFRNNDAVHVRTFLQCTCLLDLCLCLCL